jgi:hypothetical protein
MGPQDVPPAAVLLRLITARWVSAGLAAAAKLQVADHLANGARPVDEIAKEVGAHPPFLHRLLRTLASVGVFAEDEEGRFGNTPLSSLLRTGPDTLRALAIMTNEEPMVLAWNELVPALKTGESAFERVHHATLFDYFERNPEFARTFHEAMTARSATEVRAVTAAFDFSSVDTLVDVGGGHGLLLGSILAKNPTQRGVLFDLSSVIAGAADTLDRLGVTSRCELVSGSFFERIPPGADGYVMKHILHDWDDARSIQILKNIHAAARANARLFVIDAVLAKGNAPHPAKVLDLQMMVATPGGLERTRVEWDRLLKSGGFELVRVVDTGSPVGVLEAVKVE